MKQEALAPKGIACIGDILRDCGYPNSIQYAAGVDLIEWRSLAILLPDAGKDVHLYSAAVSQNFDCVDIAQILTRVNFTGKYSIVAANVPDPGMIRREVLNLNPKLDLEVLNEVPQHLFLFC